MIEPDYCGSLQGHEGECKSDLQLSRESPRGQMMAKLQSMTDDEVVSLWERLGKLEG